MGRRIERFDIVEIACADEGWRPVIGGVCPYREHILPGKPITKRQIKQAKRLLADITCQGIVSMRRVAWDKRYKRAVHWVLLSDWCPTIEEDDDVLINPAKHLLIFWLPEKIE